MLRGIPANISPELLKALADMGHGDLIVIADNFYPAVSKAKEGITVNCKGNTAAEMVDSILQLMPLDVVPIGKPLMLSPAFPPASTGHATFTASGAPSSIVSAVIHTHSFTLAKSVCYDLH